MRAKNQLREAIDTLFSRGYASSEAYTRLVLECVRFQDIDQAKRLEFHMDHHFYQSTDTFLYNRLFHLYAKSGKVSYARNLFEKLPHRDIFSWNALLSLYSKLGQVEDLRELFDRAPSRDSISYNTVISGFSRNGYASRALEVFIRMQEDGFQPTEYTYVSMLHACSKLLDLKHGKQIHAKIVISNLVCNVFVWNALTDMYAKCGEIDQARFLFDRTIKRNLVSWNSMISGYLNNRQPKKCFDLLREMQLAGLKPDQFTLSNVLGAYLQGGYIDEALRIFTEIKEKDKICWTTMISGYAQNGREEDALMLFGEMLSENVKPDSFTMSSVISACSRFASLYHGQVVHGKTIHMGVDSDLLVSSALIDMYSNCGETTDAWIIFQLMRTRNVISWNSMIVGYAQNGQDLKALALYEKMSKENVEPNDVTFVGVLSACTHAGLVEYGQGCFHSISEEHGMTPSLNHYACMINLFGRSGCMDKAVDLIKSMPHEPNCLIWSTLLSVCTINGDIDNAEMAARHHFELDPLHVAPYIMLSNMYAARGRWEDVAALRSLMKNNKVKKLAAYSWIEIDNKVHKFLAEDRTHPENEKIYKELIRLIKKLQEAGFTPDSNLVLHDVGEVEKFESICYHSEKLALVFGLMKKPIGTPIRIIKNIRVCGDCHVFMKLVSKIIGRPIILRDSNRFHHFSGGKCSCKDYW